MAVDVELFAGLAPNSPRRLTVVLEKPETVGEFVRRFGLDEDAIGLIIVDGVQRELDDPVPTACRLCLFPPVSGG